LYNIFFFVPNICFWPKQKNSFSVDHYFRWYEMRQLPTDITHRYTQGLPIARDYGSIEKDADNGKCVGVGAGSRSREICKGSLVVDKMHLGSVPKK
jgi:hypothetical protein